MVTSAPGPVQNLTIVNREITRRRVSVQLQNIEDIKRSTSGMKTRTIWVFEYLSIPRQLCNLSEVWLAIAELFKVIAVVVFDPPLGDALV